MIRDIKYGLVPNGYSGFDNRPLYNSVDSSLLLFEQIQKYINYTGDYEFIKENIYEKLEKVIENYVKGIDVDNNNIYLDEDYLISSGTENTQNTWMDAKYGNFAATPRNGKAVEINSLWYNSLMIMADLTERIENKDKKEVKNKIKKYKELAKQCKKSFNEKFYNSKRKCLFDVLGDNKIRPNQLFALSLTYPIIDANSEIAYEIINTVEKKLLNSYGLKTLAKGEPNYIEIYEGNGFKRDMSYHQGITWTWLLGLYYDSLKNMIKAEKRKTYKVELEEKLNEFVKKIRKTFEKEINERGCIGSIAEIYDSKKPQEPKGAIAQAWSVAEVFRIIL
jgi:predicted glycogen debranching enzyme